MINKYKPNNNIDFRLGDCREVLKQLPDNSVDSIVCDPPYELGFMGKKWDSTGIAFNVDMWKECLRVLKPGGHLLAFSGTRTSHRMVCAIEDAGFEIRDSIVWIHGQGFPKSQNISKMIDKASGAERKAIGRRIHPTLKNPAKVKSRAFHVETLNSDRDTEPWDVTAPATEDAKKWEGWGTNLKPANEPICLARKPISEKTVAKNVLEHGTGGLNIDACRIEGESVPINKLENWSGFGEEQRPKYKATVNDSGRWPANVIFGSDEEEYSKFFYVSKPSVKEKEAGLEHFQPKFSQTTGKKNIHPTVKSITLMEHLVQLVTPEGGTVLDPFLGSGSTGCAAAKLGYKFIGIELDPEYLEIAKARIDYWKNNEN